MTAGRDAARRPEWALAAAVAVAGWASAACGPGGARYAAASVAVPPPALAASDWSFQGDTPWSQRYSPVTALTPAAAAQLVPAFAVPLGRAGVSQESFPLEAGGVLYVAATGDQVLAVDARTGAVVWRYDPGALHPPPWAPEVTRGVGLGARRVYLLTADDRLIALDRATGRFLYGVPVAAPAAGYFESMAPLDAAGTVLVGSAGGDEGARGFIAAYDGATGAQEWRFYTVPADGQGWMPASGFHGGGVVWTTPSFDPGSGEIFFGTGNPSPDYYGQQRPGPDPYTDSVVALSVASGALSWAAQEVPHDLWDYDAASPPVLFDLGARLTVGAAGKDGYWYEWDAATGRPVVPPVAFVKQDHSPPAPGGTVEWPGPDGGANYGPTSYDPALHLAFVAGINGAEMLYGAPETHAQNTVDLGTAQGGVAGGAWTGTLTAVDVRDGQVAWQIDTATPPIGGSCVTAGGAVLFGQENGDLEAVAAATGQVVWRRQLGAPIATAPVVYELGGRVYVAVVTGGAASLQSLFPSPAAGQLVVLRLGAGTRSGTAA